MYNYYNINNHYNNKSILLYLLNSINVMETKHINTLNMPGLNSYYNDT